jgi:putative GTP pyrophosphokinase
MPSAAIKGFTHLTEKEDTMEIQLWREILDPYQIAVDELITKFNHIIASYRNMGQYSPIEKVQGRVKTISSILEKVQKKKIELDRFEEKIDDIAGIRILCQFVEDIYKVVELIKNRSDMIVIDERNYVENAKPSGYRSYHMNIKYVVETLKGPKELDVEIQVRTLAMDFWATVEHSLQYKYKQNMPQALRKQLLEASQSVSDLDCGMSEIRDEIMDAQNSFNKKAGIVADILTNIQNLYKVANKREILKIQDEFLKVYETGDLKQLERFHKELDIISEGYRAQSLK